MKKEVERFCIIGSERSLGALEDRLVVKNQRKNVFEGALHREATDDEQKTFRLLNDRTLRESELVYLEVDIAGNDFIRTLENMGKKVELVLDDKLLAPATEIFDRRYDDPGFRMLKRAFDLFFSLGGILILLPFYPIIALITFLTSKGSVLYVQERVGRDGVRFDMYKFRSMYSNAEISGPALTIKNDPRITPWGRFMRRYKIDETPQFFNVLLGHMSVVGPRPERAIWKSEIEKDSLHFQRLFKIKPGMTSLGQVKFGYAENVEEMKKRLRYDLLYLNNMSIWMDLKIIGLTLRVVLLGKSK